GRGGAVMRGATAGLLSGQRPQGAAAITFALAGLLTVSTAVTIRGDAGSPALQSLRPRSSSTAVAVQSASAPSAAGAATPSPPTPRLASSCALPLLPSPKPTSPSGARR